MAPNRNQITIFNDTLATHILKNPPNLIKVSVITETEHKKWRIPQMCGVYSIYTHSLLHPRKSSDVYFAIPQFSKE